MATSKIKKTSGYVFLLGSGSSGVTSFGRGVYDPNTKTVRISVAARSPSDMTTSTILATIPEGYRPPGNISIYGTFSTGGGMAAYYGTANTNGNITQSLGNSVREAFLYGEYSV